MVWSGSHANMKMIRTVWWSAKRKLSGLVGKSVQNGPSCSVGLAVEYNLMFWYAEKNKGEKTLDEIIRR